MLSKDVVKKVLLQANTPARTYFANILQQGTGLDPTKANSLDLEQSVYFLKYLWGSCLKGSNQRIDRIGDSVKKLDRFIGDNFKYETELHDFQTFSRKLEEFKGDYLKFVEPEEQEKVARTTELLQRFPSVGFKTATLIMRFLCLDSNFFVIDQNMLIPPLDRVNYRMCTQVLGEQEAHDRFGDEKTSFSKDEIKDFGQFGIEILGENKVLIDNLWFIGHFYCDSELGKNCRVREGALIINLPYLKGVNLEQECPFYHFCKRGRPEKSNI